jgi:hypothetical protein
MDLPEFVEFQRNPLIKTVMEFGCAITQLDAPVDYSN